METEKTSRLRVVTAELEINDLVAVDLQIIGHELGERSQVTVLKLESILVDGSDTFSEEFVDDGSGENWLQVHLLVRFEFLRPVEVDGERWHLHKWTSSVPVVSGELVSRMVFHDDFARKRQVSIEPGAPKATSVGQHVDLVEALGAALASRSDFKDGAVRVATDNFKMVNGLGAALVTGQESTDGAPVAGKVVAFTLLNRPLASFLQLNEAVLGQDALAVVDRMEVTGRCVEANEDFTSVLTRFSQKILREGVATRS